VRIRFWGTRGSIATPGPGTTRFGGNTSCVELTTSDGGCFVFDCGTGARTLGAELMARASAPLAVTILLSHTHWDHIQGFPFFAPLFVPGSRITVCGPEGSARSLREVLAGQMEFTYFPVDIAQLPAAITFRELGEGTHEMGNARILAQYLHHPAMTLGYRIEADGASAVYLLGNGTLFGLHQHEQPAPSEQFTEFRVGLDHVSFGVGDRGELEKWARRLDELGIAHGGIKDAAYGSGVSFRDPDGIALEFFAPPS